MMFPLVQPSKTPLKFGGSLEDSQNSEQLFCSAASSQSERMRLKSAKDKGAQRGVLEDQARAASCPLLEESHGQYLTLPATTSDICEVLPTREAHPRLGIQGFYWGSVM